MLLNEIEHDGVKPGQSRAVFLPLSNVVAKASQRVLKIAFGAIQLVLCLKKLAFFVTFFSHVVFLQLVDGVATTTLSGGGVAFYFGGAV